MSGHVCRSKELLYYHFIFSTATAAAAWGRAASIARPPRPGGRRFFRARDRVRFDFGRSARQSSCLAALNYNNNNNNNNKIMISCKMYPFVSNARQTN